MLSLFSYLLAACGGAFQLRIAVDDQLKGVAMGAGAGTVFIVVFIGILAALTVVSIAAQLGRILGLI